VAKPDPAAPTAPGPPLDPLWRGALGIVGLALVVASLYLWFAPPQQSRFAPAATNGTGVAKVDSPSETLSVALLGLGVLLLVVAANGRRLSALKIGGNEVDWLAAAAAGATRAKAKHANLNPKELDGAVMYAQALTLPALQSGHFDLDEIADKAIASARSDPTKES
jgi:hypothetical protein